MSLKIICTFRKKKIYVIAENYIESWDSEPQHSMVGKLWINYQNFATSFRSNVFNPIWRHCLLDDCSPCSCSALPQHSPLPLTGTVYPRYSKLTLLFTQVFALKVTLEELFYTVVLTYPLHHYYLPCICMCVGGVCVCVCVCGCGCVQTPFKSLDGKRTLVTILMSLAHNRLPGMC